MKKTILCLAAAALVAVAFTGAAFAAKPGGGNAASSKAVFSNNPNGVTFLPFVPPDFPGTEACGMDSGFDPPNNLCTPWMKLFDLPEAIKTSHTGALEAVVSLECSLWTNTEVQVIIGGTQSSGARAGVQVRVSVDGVLMEPGRIVYCDRLQFIRLTVPLLFVGAAPVTSNSPFVLRLFQRTKAAHAYHWYLPTPATDIHSIVVEVRGIVRCFKDGGSVTCEEASIDIDAMIFGGTKAAIGKSTVVIEEHQNWRIIDDGV